MPLRLEFRPEASADVAEAFSWYERQRAGLGAEFEAQLDRTLSFIRDMPAAGRPVYRTLRRALVRRFPFAIYYVLGRDLNRGPGCAAQPSAPSDVADARVRPNLRLELAGASK